ncbi:MAG: hypothetical protein ACHQIM_09105 [Sphingobacteriales bacterium]
MEDQLILKEQELDDREIQALIEDFDTVGILLKSHRAIINSPILTPKNQKMCEDGLALIKKLTQKCLKHYGISHLSK